MAQPYVPTQYHRPTIGSYSYSMPSGLVELAPATPAPQKQQQVDNSAVSFTQAAQSAQSARSLPLQSQQQYALAQQYKPPQRAASVSSFQSTVSQAPPPPYQPQTRPPNQQAQVTDHHMKQSIPLPQQPPGFQQAQQITVTLEQMQLAAQYVQSLPPEKLQKIQEILPAQQMHFSPPPSNAIVTPGPPQQQQQEQLPLHYVSTKPSGLFGTRKSSKSHEKYDHSKDAQQTDKVTRFLGDTLFGRVARAGVTTVTSTMKMPAALSPWGDNSPITLPNVRYRDAALFTTFAFVGAPLVEGTDGIVSDIFGADSFVSDVVSSGAGFIVGSTVVKYGVFQIVEQAIDKGVIEHMLPEEEKILQTHNVKSLQVGLKHKLMGVDADIRFHGTRSTTDSSDCSKGWFCPYLFASARTPLIPRASDFNIACFYGPFLGADYAMAHKLLSEAPHALALCDSDPTHDIGCNRMIVTFTGIAPYRANMWSTSRRPGCGTLIFHVFDGVPALIIPVSSKAPIMAWSPWTLKQMRAGVQNGGIGYDPEQQHAEICEWLDTFIDHSRLDERIKGRYVDILGRSMSLVVNGALGLDAADHSVLAKIDPERAGMVMFRY